MLDNEPTDHYFLINTDSVDIEYISLESGNPGVLVTSIDVNGDPVHHAYNLESLSVMLSDLKIAQESLVKMTGQDDYVI